VWHGFFNVSGLAVKWKTGVYSFMNWCPTAGKDTSPTAKAILAISSSWHHHPRGFSLTVIFCDSLGGRCQKGVVKIRQFTICQIHGLTKNRFIESPFLPNLQFAKSVHWITFFWIHDSSNSVKNELFKDLLDVVVGPGPPYFFNI